MCDGDCVCRALPSACMLMFWLSPDVCGWEASAYPSANDSAQMRVGAQQLDATEENYACGRSGEEKEI